MLEESSNTVAAYWSNVLKTIEPTVVQIFHHIEAVFVSATKQIIREFCSPRSCLETIIMIMSTCGVPEFLYARQQELMQSPYYAHTQNMTQDLDRFYKDLMQNDFLTNFKKYCLLLYDVIKAKYYPLIPFGEYCARFLNAGARANSIGILYDGRNDAGAGLIRRGKR